TLMRTTPEECSELGRRVAERLNGARGPLTILIPLHGLSMIATEGGPFYDPEADEALINGLRQNLDESVDVRLVEADINSYEFATAAADALIFHIRETQ